jgi:hypothetical protein
VFEELDESGGRRDRPLLEQAICRVERGESHGLVVAYLSRFGRSLIDGLAAIERITRAGGTFVSVQDGLDCSTDTGKLILRFLLSVAEWELDRTRTGWVVARERAVLRGVYPSIAPFGYARGRDGRLRPDSQTAPVLVELFRRRAAGARFVDLRDFLRELEMPSPTGSPVWPIDTLARVLSRRAYLGEAHCGSVVNQKAHLPLLTQAEWDSAQLGYRPRGRRPGLPEPLLFGLVFCAGCGRRMHSETESWPASYASRKYCCHRYGDPRPCRGAASIRDSVIEPYIEELFWQELSKRRPDAAQRRVHQLETELERRTLGMHAAGLHVLLGTIAPAGGFAVPTYGADQIRLPVNAWIRSQGLSDGVIDFDAAIRDPSNPSRILPAYDDGDHLHYSAAGYEALADAVPLGQL